ARFSGLHLRSAEGAVRVARIGDAAGGYRMEDPVAERRGEVAVDVRDYIRGIGGVNRDGAAGARGDEGGVGNDSSGPGIEGGGEGLRLARGPGSQVPEIPLRDGRQVGRVGSGLGGQVT